MTKVFLVWTMVIMVGLLVLAPAEAQEAETVIAQATSSQPACVYYLTPAKLRVASGETAAVTVCIDAGQKPTAAFTSFISYDPDIISVDTDTSVDRTRWGSFSQIQFFNPARDHPGRASVVISDFDMFNSHAGVLEVGVIHFKALAPGTTSLKFEDNPWSVVNDPNGGEYPLDRRDGVVEVNPGETNAP